MEAGVLNFTNDCRSDDSAKQQTRRLSFSKELISFSLYGKIPRKSSEYRTADNPNSYDTHHKTTI